MRHETTLKFGINFFSTFGLRTNSRRNGQLRFDHHYADALQSKRMESVMKLNSAQVEQTLTQFEAQVIPDDHPLVPKLNELFGDHTFFLDSTGLNVVEPNESIDAGAPAGGGVNVAKWSDAPVASLAPHAPQPREVERTLSNKHLSQEI